MKKRAAVISMIGLGDGLMSLVLSRNLALNGFEADTFHNGGFSDLQKWFPSLPIKPFPDMSETVNFLNSYDLFFVCFSDDPFVQNLITEGKKLKKENFFVINPSYSKNYNSAPFYGDTAFLPNLTFSQNIKRFCLENLKFSFAVDNPGVENPYNLIFRKNSLRIILHPTAAKRGRMWKKERFIKLACKLREMGFSPCFVVSQKEFLDWETMRKEGLDVLSFSNFDKLASFVYESGYMIGNDSGVGHLASAMGLPTITIARSFRSLKLWRPSWGKNILVYPPLFLPNIKKFRFRDRYWQYFVSVRRILKKFKKLLA